MSERTEDDWLASLIGYAAMFANGELKKIFSLAEREGLQTGPNSYIGNLWEGGVASYDNARAAWLAGDERKAAKYVVYSAMIAGLAARDSAMMQRRIARKTRKPEPITKAKQWHAAGQDWPDIVKRLVETYGISPQRARKICRDADRPKQKTTKSSR